MIDSPLYIYKFINESFLFSVEGMCNCMYFNYIIKAALTCANSTFPFPQRNTLAQAHPPSYTPTLIHPHPHTPPHSHIPIAHKQKHKAGNCSGTQCCPDESTHHWVNKWPTSDCLVGCEDGGAEVWLCVWVGRVVMGTCVDIVGLLHVCARELLYSHGLQGRVGFVRLWKRDWGLHGRLKKW